MKTPANPVSIRFSHAAEHYDSYAALQQKALHLVSPVLAAQFTPESLILDAGCGTAMLARLQPSFRFIGLDVAEGMCRYSSDYLAGRVINADMNALPLQSDSVSGVVSSLAYQWLTEPLHFARESLRITQSGGHLVLATLTEGTLAPLQSAFVRAFGRSPLLDFAPENELQQIFSEAGWQVSTCTTHIEYTTHPSLLHLLRSMKQIGATASRSAPLIRHKSDLMALQEEYIATSPESNAHTLNAPWKITILQAHKS